MHRSRVQDGQADLLSCSMSACRRKARPLGRPGFFVDTSSLFRLSLRFVASWAGRRVGCRQRTHNPPPKGRRGFEPHPAHQGFQRLLDADFLPPPSAKPYRSRTSFIWSARLFPLRFFVSCLVAKCQQTLLVQARRRALAIQHQGDVSPRLSLRSAQAGRLLSHAASAASGQRDQCSRFF